MNQEDNRFEWERVWTDKRCVKCYKEAKYYKKNTKTYLMDTVVCKKHYKRKRRKEARDASRQLEKIQDNEK